jgi:hypothetical protein
MEELLDRVSAHGPYGYRPHLVPAIVFLVGRCAMLPLTLACR